MEGFAEVFGELEDPRTGNAKRHLLLEILLIALCAVLSGGGDCTDMAPFGRAKGALLRQFLRLPSGRYRQVKLEGDGEAPKLARAANLCGSLGASDLGPDRERLRTDSSVVGGRKMIAVQVEEVVDLVVGGEEPLRLAGWFEPLHLPFASPCRLVRVLGPIVQALVPAVLDPRHQLLLRRRIARQLVQDTVAIQVASSGRRDGRPPCRPRGSPGPRPAAGPSAGSRTADRRARRECRHRTPRAPAATGSPAPAPSGGGGSRRAAPADAGHGPRPAADAPSAPPARSRRPDRRRSAARPRGPAP